MGWIPSIFSMTFSTSVNPKWELFPFFSWDTSTFVPSSFILVAKWPPLSFPPITLVPHKHLSKPSGEGKQEKLQKGIPNTVVEMEKGFTLSTLVHLWTVLDLSYKEVTSQRHFMVFWLYVSIQSPL